MSQPHLVVKTANNTVPVELVHERVSGVLKGIGVAGGTSYHYLRVWIDGDELETGFLAGTFGGGYANNGLSCDLPFERELLIEAWDAPSASPQTMFWVSYLTDARAVPMKEETEEVGGTTYLYTSGGYEPGGPEAHERPGFRVLRGVERRSHVALDRDLLLLRDGGFDVIAGTVMLRSLSGEPLFVPRVPLGLRPSGQSTMVVGIDLIDVEGEQRFQFSADTVRYLLAELYDTRRGCLELVADLPGYANYPALLP